MWEFHPPRVRIRGSPSLEERVLQQIRRDFERFRDGLPRPLEGYVLETYGINLASSYGGLRVKNPFGKASGQLSLAQHQIEKDAEAGLGFVILKTVIAQNAGGEQSMREWAIPETRMLVERIRGRSGELGWTVTWKGRGWYDTFEAYRKLFGEGLALGKDAEMLVVPSVKYHLPTPHEDFWKEDEYKFTTGALLETWDRHHRRVPMPLEKDFSPTLAGSERAKQQEKILEWLQRVPGLVHRSAPGRVKVGLKIFNALFDDGFQLRMLETIHAPSPGDDRADFFVYANRLFDPEKSFEGKTGVAYGGPDLSDRNLAVLENFLATTLPGRPPSKPLPLSSTGDILSGRVAAEYLLRGASTFQMHTLFQLPDNEFAMKVGSKSEKALHRLLFHPQEGFIGWNLELRQRFGWKSDATIEDVARWCRENWATVTKGLASSASRLAACESTSSGLSKSEPRQPSLLPIKLRVMTAADIAAGMRLKEIAGWNQTPSDWEFFLRSSPEGCFVAEADGRVVGTATTIDYEGRFAWISMVLVDPEYRGRGIGTRLLEETIAYLDGRRVPTLKLDATPQGKPIYERLGFVSEYEIERWALRRAPGSGWSGTAMPRPDLDGILELDREVFGADRSGLLRMLNEGSPDLTLEVREGREITGYALARRGSRADHLGPWMAREESTAESLLSLLLLRSSRETIFVDCMAASPFARKLLKHYGFEFQRPLTRMFRGPNKYPGYPGLVCAIVGPEFG